MNKSAEDGAEESSLVNVDDVFQETIGVSGEVSERFFTGPDFLKNNEGFFNDLNDVLIGIGCLLEVIGTLSSGVNDDGQVRSVFGELFLGDGEVAGGSKSLGGAAVEGFGGFLEGGGGVTNFLCSEFVFRGTFSLLLGEKVVVVHLFFGDGLLEIG